MLKLFDYEIMGGMSNSKSAENNSGEVQGAISAIADWRGTRLMQIRDLILEANPQMKEEIKWRKPSNNMQGVPVWSNNGIVCTGEFYKDKIKITFARGAALEDPEKVFNTSLNAGTRRAIDLYENDTLNKTAFKELILGASTLNDANTT